MGLKTIDVLDYARSLIKKRYGIDIDYYSLPLDDEKTYQVISSERNYGVFQLEEAGISNFANKCKPKSIHDIYGCYQRFDIFQLHVNRAHRVPVKFYNEDVEDKEFIPYVETEDV